MAGRNPRSKWNLIFGRCFGTPAILIQYGWYYVSWRYPAHFNWRFRGQAEHLKRLQRRTEEYEAILRMYPKKKENTCSSSSPAALVTRACSENSTGT